MWCVFVFDRALHSSFNFLEAIEATFLPMIESFGCSEQLLSEPLIRLASAFDVLLNGLIFSNM